MRAPGAVLLIAAGCGATVTNEQLRGDAAVDAPTTPAVCRYAVREPVVVSDPADPSRFHLLDAIATPDGAMIAWRESVASASDNVHVRRVRDDGSVHPWSAPGRASRGVVASLPPGGPEQFSMVWDAAREGVAMLVAGDTNRGGCAFARFLGDDTQLVRVIDVGALMGFAHSGCGSLARVGGGYTFLTTQVRALWGDELVSLTDDGRVVEPTLVLPMTGWLTIELMTRSAVAEGFVATWIEPGREMPAQTHSLHARRYDAAGGARGADTLLARSRGLAHATVVEAGGGLLAAWRSDDPTATPAHALVVRALAPDGTAAGEARVLGGARVATGVHAAVRGGDVLAVGGSDDSALALYAVDARGAVRAGPIGLLRGGETTSGVVRVIPTARGALVAYESGSGAPAGRVLVVPIDCLP